LDLFPWKAGVARLAVEGHQASQGSRCCPAENVAQAADPQNLLRVNPAKGDWHLRFCRLLDNRPPPEGMGGGPRKSRTGVPGPT
jgi:hypothetical protein